MPLIPRVPTGNNQQYTLDAQAAAGATSVTLNSSVASVVRAPGYFVVDRIDTSGNKTATKREYKKFTGVSGAQLTGVTNVDGTDQVHAVGAIVEFVPDVKYEQDWYDAVVSDHDTYGTHVSLASLTLLNSKNLSVYSNASIRTLDLVRLNVGTHLNASGASLTGVFPSGASGTYLISNGTNAPSWNTISAGVVRFQSVATSLVSIGSASYVDFMATSLPNTFSTGFGKVTFHADLSPSASLTSDWQILVNNVQVYYTQMVWPSESGFFRPWTMTFGTTLASGATITVQAKTNSGSVSHNNGAYRLILAEL